MNISNSNNSQQAVKIITGLQSKFVKSLEQVSDSLGDPIVFEKISWLRNAGLNGGGFRYVTGANDIFNRAAVNYSHVQYDDDFDKKLRSATAISTIIHPANPHAASVHMHYSFTELKDGSNYWRLMADLNPSLVNDSDRKKFMEVMQSSSGKHFAHGKDQGDKYFNIPALGRTRGVAHFYLEGFTSNNFVDDCKFTDTFGQNMIDCYSEILKNALETRTEISENDRLQQLDYHTLYLLQVLTLDRGTTSGLLVHNENDIGILGSIPQYINRDLLKSWVSLMPSPHDILLNDIIKSLPNLSIVEVGDIEKQQLAEVVRAHFLKYPESLELQAKGDIIPPTVTNHSN